MILDPATVLALALRCAPTVAPTTLLAVARTESGLDPLVIGVNRGGRQIPQPHTRQEAIATARSLLVNGANFDLGLVQINSTNLARLGLTIEDAFDPCRNLAAGALMLQAGYVAARPSAPGDQAALRTALSLYNTGTPQRGFRNGYVARVQASAPPQATLEGPSPSAPTWDVFGDLRAASFVTHSARSIEGAAP
jgi:type IV secretion system protein VirB1